MLILQAVPMLGWSAEKHAKNLTLFGALDRLEDGSEVETVKKFIRDLRQRHQKYVNERLCALRDQIRDIVAKKATRRVPSSRGA